VRELHSIVDYGRAQPSEPTIDPVFGAVPAWYLSSTPFARLP